MLRGPVEFFLSQKVCPECGGLMKEQAELYMLECEHCLSKKDE